MTDIPIEQRLIVALDVPTITKAHELITLLSPVVTTFKIGYWLMFDPGYHLLVHSLKKNDKKLFLDAKLNDIPETVRHGVISAANSGADFITVHSDEATLEAAIQGKGDSLIKIMAVTALSSQTYGSSRERFRAGVCNAIITHCDGLIMSPIDLTDPLGIITNGNIRDLIGDMLIATPGVRMSEDKTHDHARSGTPAQAIHDGADYLIVGRPIIHAIDPLAAATMFLSQIAPLN